MLVYIILIGNLGKIANKDVIETSYMGCVNFVCTERRHVAKPCYQISIPQAFVFKFTGLDVF